jgi:hypothetical protein
MVITQWHKLFLILALLVYYQVFAQIPYAKLDSQLDFQERFYNKGELTTTNSFLYLDSNIVYRLEDLQELGIDPFRLERVKHGKWISYYDKNWRETDQRKFDYYSLEEFEFGIIRGKAYYFSKDDKLHHVTQRYPSYFDSTFNGYRIVWYDNKERIKSVQYELFKSPDNAAGYYNYTVYFPDGTIKSFSLADDRTASYHVVEFNKRGKILYELRNDEQATYKLQQRLFGWIIIKETLEEGVNYRYRYVFGKLRKKKIMND